MDDSGRAPRPGENCDRDLHVSCSGTSFNHQETRILGSRHCLLGAPCIRQMLDRCCSLLLQYLIQSCARGRRRMVEDTVTCYEIRRAEACVN